MSFNINFSILVISDRSSQNLREDLSGPALRKYIEENGWTVSMIKVIPDEAHEIIRILREWCNLKSHPHIIVTTGGTGFAARDITPEATRSLIEKEAPGLSEIIRLKGMESSIYSILSRGVTGIYKNTIIINLPGNPKAAVESLSFIKELIPHAVSILNNDPSAEIQHLGS
jgi:molybdopterin adenylyltransferase